MYINNDDTISICFREGGYYGIVILRKNGNV
jgi:hypothetical protein